MVQKEVADMLKGRVLVGHALHNDLKVHTTARTGVQERRPVPYVLMTICPHEHSSVCACPLNS